MQYAVQGAYVFMDWREEKWFMLQNWFAQQIPTTVNQASHLCGGGGGENSTSLSW